MNQRSKLERLCHYITRPAIADERLARNKDGQVVLMLKMPYRDGTTLIVLSPLEFMQRLGVRWFPGQDSTSFASMVCRVEIIPQSKKNNSIQSDVIDDVKHSQASARIS